MSTPTFECVNPEKKKDCHRYKRYEHMVKESEEVFRHVKCLCEWEKILGCRRQMEGKGWAFRGLRDATRKLESSLRRYRKYFPNYLKDLKKAEIVLLRDFRRRFHHYSTYVPREDDCLEWLSLMQHHGAPTRLLDFTYSIYIAAYFALEKPPLEEPKDHYAIWAINTRWAAEKCKEIFKDTEVSSYFEIAINEKTVHLFPEAFMPEKPRQFVSPGNPFRLSERLTIQKGVFMCPGDITTSFENNLRALKAHDSEENVMKLILVLDEDQRRAAIEDLYDLNISRATLFPGLDGYASSLAVSTPKHVLPPKDEHMEYLKC